MNKKIISLLSALSLSVPVLALAACGDNKGADTKPTNTAALDSIRLNSDPEQKLNVGDVDMIIYDAKADGKVVKNGVDFTSSDPNVVTVDEFGNVEAVGVGSATVTLTLKNNDKVTSKVKYDVSKTFFMTKPGFVNGNAELSTAELYDWIRIKEGEQTQVLVSECSEYWYFSTTLEHTGRTGQDSSGRWGVGSFRVDSGSSLGEVMMWFGMKPTNHAEKKYTPYVGGWRVMSGGIDPEIEIDDPIANSAIATYEIIRNGVDHYCTITVGDTVSKYVYTTPGLAGVPTYPGIYSQAQEIYASEFTAASGKEAVEEKLNNFQVAEDVVIDGLTDTLFAGEKYQLKSTVSPSYTYNKGVKYALKEAVEGVTITEQGELTIGAGVTGEVTVVATAVSNAEVTAERTYTVTAKAASAHTLFDTAAAIGSGYTLTDAGVNYTASGNTYLPLNAKGSKWAVTYTTALSAGTVGVYGATNGLIDYVGAVVENGKLVYGAKGNQKTIACNTAATNTVTVIRDGSFYMIVVNGRLVDRLYAPMAGDTIPVIVGNGAVGGLTELALVTEADEVDALIATYPFTVGKYVTMSDGNYTIAPMEFDVNVKNDINWPPVNNYENGLKFANTLTGDYTVEFTMSGIDPFAKGGKIDSKILVYLRSESKTASLQFVVKGDTANKADAKVTFCPNLNDATWTEYDMPDSVNLLGDEPVTVKVVKRGNVVELYLNGVRVFEGNPGLTNAGYWNEDTECTPGIGSYYCGVTISDVKLTAAAETTED